MVSKFFGQYLIDLGVISGYDLVRVLKLQEKYNLPFGGILIKMGMMTAEQTTEIYAAQKYDDLSFGELAVKNGFLTVEQLNRALKAKEEMHMRLGQALVALGVLGREQLDKHLKNFEQQLKTSTVDDVVIPAGVSYHPVFKYIIESYCKMLLRLTDIPFHLGQGCCYGDEPFSHQVVVSIEVAGDAELQFSYGLSDKTRILLSSSLLRDDDIFLPELSIQNKTLRNFTELVVESAITKASEEGYSLVATMLNLYDRNLTENDQPQEFDISFPIFLPDGELIHLALLTR